MAKIPAGPQAGEFHYRPGSDPFGASGWRLVDTEVDPASLDPNQLQWGENIRLRGKGIMTRPGLVLKLDLGSAAGSILHFGALPVDNPRTRIWMSGLGAYGSAGTLTGSGLSHYDPSEPIAFQQHSHYLRAADFQMPIARYGTSLFVGDKSTLRVLVDVRGPYGIEALTAIPTPPCSPVVSWPGYTIRCMQEFDGLLFVGLENNTVPTSSKIAVWNTLTATNDITGIRPPKAMGIWRNSLVVGFDATAAHIRVRDAGAAPGSWTTFALAGSECSGNGNAIAEVGDSVWIAGGNTKLFRFEGTALTLARTIGGADATGSGITSVCLHRGLLYYGWNTPTATFASRIGRHDPDSTAANEWTDTYKDLTTAVPNFKQLSSMLSYRGQLYAGGAQAWVVATAQNDVQGTPESVHDTGVPATDFRVMQMLRYV